MLPSTDKASLGEPPSRSLIGFPNELLFKIGSFLPCIMHVYSAMLFNRRLFHSILHFLPEALFRKLWIFLMNC